MLSCCHGPPLFLVVVVRLDILKRYECRTGAFVTRGDAGGDVVGGDGDGDGDAGSVGLSPPRG